MVNDSLNNLKRALRQSYQGTLRKLGFWTLIAVSTEILAIDLFSILVQLVTLGYVQQPLLINPSMLGFPVSASGLAGSILLKAAAYLVLLLALRLLFSQVCDRLTGNIETIIATELRTRLFRESHRTSGQLITPDAAEQTLTLIQTAARQYGRARSLVLRQRLGYVMRTLGGILLLGLVRWDISLMISAGLFLLIILETRHRDNTELTNESMDTLERNLRDDFREELRESYQARVIGSQLGKGRPSDQWIERWLSQDQLLQANRLLQNSTLYWGRLAIFATVLFAITVRSLGHVFPMGSAIALMSILSGGMLSWNFSKVRMMGFRDDSKWIVPIHDALTSAVRIWDLTDATLMPPCRLGMEVKGLPLGISPTDPRSSTPISFEIPARRVTAIVCPDVQYRRKLMRWMARWEDPFQGSIQMDSKDLREFSIASTRLQIGSIRSDSYVNNGSVLENITLNDPNGDILSAIAAARDVHAHRIIQRLPEGYSTVINADNHFEQTVYDRFLIALARGRWHDPSILLVEEPSPAMSRGMRELLRDAYRRLSRERTVVVFTRHAASVLAADHVVIIGTKKVIQGSPTELMQKNMKFKRAMNQIGKGVKPKNKKNRPASVQENEPDSNLPKSGIQA